MEIALRNLSARRRHPESLGILRRQEPVRRRIFERRRHFEGRLVEITKRRKELRVLFVVTMSPKVSSRWADVGLLRLFGDAAAPMELTFPARIPSWTRGLRPVHHH